MHVPSDSLDGIVSGVICMHFVQLIMINRSKNASF